MARVYTSGFETNSTTANVEWTSYNGAGATIDSTTKRSGSYALKMTTTTGTRQGVIQRWLSAAGTGPYFLRFYLYIGTLPNSTDTIAVISNGDALTSGAWGRLDLNTSGTLTLYYHDGAVYQTVGSSSALSTGTWYRIEVKVDYTGGAGTGVIEAKIDGASAFATTSTATFGASGFLAFRLGTNMISNADTAGILYFDDIALNDNTGSAQTGYPGDGKVVAIRPDGAGDNAMGSRGGADSGSDYGQVDEVTPNDATDYYILDIFDDILDVACQSSSDVGIGSSDTITLVQVNARIRGADSTAMTYNTRVKSAASGTVNAGTSVTISSSSWVTNDDSTPQVVPKHTSYTDPTTGSAWTPTGTNSIDNMQLGITPTDATPDLWVSTLWANVEYVPSAGGGTSTTQFLMLMGVGT